jgi:hypothetical protein
MTSPIAEVLESYAETAKDLLTKWRAYGSQVTTNLDSTPYKADTAAADLGAAVSLAIETGAELSMAVFNAVAMLLEDYDDEIKLVDLSSPCAGAKLEWEKDLTNGFGDVIPRARTKILPSQLGDGQQAFRVRVDTTDCRAGVYEGRVRASAPDGQTDPVGVRVDVP